MVFLPGTSTMCVFLCAGRPFPPCGPRGFPCSFFMEGRERLKDLWIIPPSFRRPWGELTEHDRTTYVKKDVRVKRSWGDTGEPAGGRLVCRPLSLKVLCCFWRRAAHLALSAAVAKAKTEIGSSRDLTLSSTWTQASSLSRSTVLAGTKHLADYGIVESLLQALMEETLWGSRGPLFHSSAMHGAEFYTRQQKIPSWRQMPGKQGLSNENDRTRTQDTLTQTLSFFMVGFCPKVKFRKCGAVTCKVCPVG